MASCLKNYVLQIFCGVCSGVAHKLYLYGHYEFDNASTRNRIHKKYSPSRKEARLQKTDRKPIGILPSPKVATRDDHFFFHYNRSCDELDAVSSCGEG